MKILVIKRETLGRDDISEAIKKLGHDIYYVEAVDVEDINNTELSNKIREAIEMVKCDAVFSSNYFPLVSECCNRAGVKYISWVYDCPQLALYSYTVLYPCNYIFLFDKAMYEELVKVGVKTVYYAPLASCPERYDGMIVTDSIKQKYSSDTSFVGALYNEEHNLYDRLSGLSEASKGYLDGIIEAQMKVSGYYFIEEMLNKALVEEMVRVTGFKPTPGGAETAEYVFAHYFIGRRITQLERQRLLQAASNKFELKLYTWQATPQLPKAINMGIAGYNNEMPMVFKNSKINLNITLRSIRSGIPLRCFDIMACKGFLLSNYQADFNDCFVEGEDYVYYTDEKDMLEKIEYYLSHEKERMEIAENGYKRVKDYHTYEKRLKDMFYICFEQA